MSRTILAGKFCSCQDLSTGGPTEVCCVTDKLQTSLQKYFSYTSFHDGQLEALLPLLHGRDVFVRMATGSGKSLCMFLGPLAISESAIGMVISPLNGLMEQQVCYFDYKPEIDNFRSGIPYMGRCRTCVRMVFQQFKLVKVIKRSLKVYPWESIGLVRDSSIIIAL